MRINRIFSLMKCRNCVKWELFFSSWQTSINLFTDLLIYQKSFNHPLARNMPIKYPVLFALFILCFVGWTPSINAQRIQNYVSEDSLAVGDTFTYTIVDNKRNSEERLILPDSSAFGDFIYINDIKHFKLEPRGDSVVYSLSFFGDKDTLLPIRSVSMSLPNGDTVDYIVASAPLFFKSVLPDTSSTFKPYKPLITFTNLFWLFVTIFAIILAYAIWYFYRKYKRAQENKELEIPAIFNTTPFINPIKVLETRLYELKKIPAEYAIQDAKSNYIKLGNAFRAYFEEVYKFPALELTSSEIIRKIRSQTLDQKLIGTIAKMLRDADMVKFAKFIPTEELWNTHISDALNLLEQFKLEDIGRIDALKRAHDELEQDKLAQFEEQQKMVKKQREEDVSTLKATEN